MRASSDCLFLFSWVLTISVWHGNGLFHLDYQIHKHKLAHSIFIIHIIFMGSVMRFPLSFRMLAICSLSFLYLICLEAYQFYQSFHRSSFLFSLMFQGAFYLGKVLSSFNIVEFICTLSAHSSPHEGEIQGCMWNSLSHHTWSLPRSLKS